MAGTKFSELTDSDIEYISSVYNTTVSHKEKVSMLSSRYGVSDRTIRSWWTKIGVGNIRYSGVVKSLELASENDVTDSSDILLVTSAQCKTPIHKSLLDNMFLYKDFIESSTGLSVGIVVLPILYRNPTTPGEARVTSEVWWDPHVTEHLHYGKYYFGDVLISADTRVNLTNSRPLSGYEALASKNHLIIGHPRVQSKLLPRFKGSVSRMMSTSLSLTIRNYSDSKLGELGGIHHVYGFTVIEKRKEDKSLCYYPRHVKANQDGSFTDIMFNVSSSGVKVEGSCKGFIFGDMHISNIDLNAYNSFKSVCESVNPEVVVLHDTFDGETINHHNNKNMYIKKKIHDSYGHERLDSELNSCISFLKSMSKDFKDSHIYIIQSNHDDFIDKYINNTDWRSDITNSTSILKLALIQQSEDLDVHGNIYGHLINTEGDMGNVSYLKSSSGLVIGGYECGSHGHIGYNGAKGSISTFKKLNVKIVYGHGHSPATDGSVTRVGVTCKLWQGYNSSGLSDWGFGSCIIHNNNKSQLIVLSENSYWFTNLL